MNHYDDEFSYKEVIITELVCLSLVFLCAILHTAGWIPFIIVVLMVSVAIAYTSQGDEKHSKKPPSDDDNFGGWGW